MKVTSITKRFGMKFAGKLDLEGVGTGVILSYDFSSEIAVDVGGTDERIAKGIADQIQAKVVELVDGDIHATIKRDPKFSLLVRSAEGAVDKVHQRDRARSQPQSPVRKVYQGFSRQTHQPVFREPTTVRRGK